MEYCDKASELVYKVEHEFDLIERKYNKLIEQKTIFARGRLQGYTISCRKAQMTRII